MKVTRICCDICNAEIPKQLCNEVSIKYLISNKIETLDLCRNCFGKMVDFACLLKEKEVGEANELLSY